MRHSSLCLACAATLAFAAPGAQAVTCDIVLDRNGNVIYQDTLPPVDLSERGAAARDKMRQRGEQLLIIDADQCPQLVFSTVTGAASVESIVAEMRPYNAITGGMGVNARTSGAGIPAGIPSGAPSSGAPSSAPAAARSSGSPGRY
jgi:hypothetical protein